MITSNIKAVIHYDVHKVWNTVTDIEKYHWRSDLSKVELINEKEFVEYSKDGYSTKFITTFVEPYKRWEFDMENNNMTGHWIGTFTAIENGTCVDFTEYVRPNKWFMNLFIKQYLKKQQTQFINDLKNKIE